MQKKLIIYLCWAYCLVLFSFNTVPASASEVPGNEMKNGGALNIGGPAVSSSQSARIIDAPLVAQAQQDNSSGTTDPGPRERKFFPFPRRVSPPLLPPQAQPVQPPTTVLPEAQQQPSIQEPVQPQLVTSLPQQPAARKGDISFNFDDADVYSVLQTIFGDVLKVNYIVDARVKGRVTFRSVSPVVERRCTSPDGGHFTAQWNWNCGGRGPVPDSPDR